MAKGSFVSALNWCAPCSRCCRIGDGIDNECPLACNCGGATPLACQTKAESMFCGAVAFEYYTKNQFFKGTVNSVCAAALPNSLPPHGCPGICPGGKSPHMAEWFHFDEASMVCSPCADDDEVFRTRLTALLDPRRLPWDGWTHTSEEISKRTSAGRTPPTFGYIYDVGRVGSWLHDVRPRRVSWGRRVVGRGLVGGGVWTSIVLFEQCWLSARGGLGGTISREGLGGRAVCGKEGGCCCCIRRSHPRAFAQVSSLGVVAVRGGMHVV